MTMHANKIRREASALVGIVAAVATAACSTMPVDGGDSAFASCPAYTPAYEVTDEFMRTFNTKDAEAWGKTFHFPSVRIASGTVRIINGPQDLESGFATLGAQGWDRSAWAKREVVQCGPTKAHMLTTFVRYRADGSEMSRFESLYIVEQKNGRWALTARSSFAP
jgi:hypothetical protein